MKDLVIDQIEIKQTQIPLNLDKVDRKEIPSPVIARLIEEVRNEEVHSINAYNRMHNRHNRSR